MNSLYMLNMNPLLDVSLANTFSSPVNCVFVQGAPSLCRVLQCAVVPGVCSCLCLGRRVQKHTTKAQVRVHCGRFWEFRGPGLTPKSFIRFGFPFSCGVRKESTFVFSRICAVFPTPFVERPSFLRRRLLPPLSLAAYVWVYGALFCPRMCAFVTTYISSSLVIPPRTGGHRSKYSPATNPWAHGAVTDPLLITHRTPRRC